MRQNAFAAPGPAGGVYRPLAGFVEGNMEGVMERDREGKGTEGREREGTGEGGWRLKLGEDGRP